MKLFIKVRHILADMLARLQSTKANKDCCKTSTYNIKRGEEYLRIINGIYMLWTTDQQEATKLTLEEISHITSVTGNPLEIVSC